MAEVPFRVLLCDESGTGISKLGSGSVSTKYHGPGDIIWLDWQKDYIVGFLASGRMRLLESAELREEKINKDVYKGTPFEAAQVEEGTATEQEVNNGND